MNAIRLMLLIGVISSAVLSAAVGLDWEHDQIVLQAVADAVLQDAPISGDGIEKLNDWVYHDHSFAKNHHYFLLPRLGATPIQILRHGGDCADKSRLLSAMLQTLGVRSGLVMLYPCSSCAPVHTVVEIQSRSIHMVADPIWDVDYREGRRELARSDDAAERVTYFRTKRSGDRKLRLMPPQDYDFRFAKAVNFNATSETRAAADLLRWIGDHPSRLLRPSILEEPKKFISVASALFSAFLFLSWGVVHLVSKRRRDNR